MKFGIVLPNSAPYCSRDLFAEAAVTAEESGFDYLLIWDHYMLPDSDESFDCWILLSYLASKTSKIRLGTCVTPIPFRPPAILAKMVSTLDLVSDGRAVLGVGAGWYRAEFEGYSRWDKSSIRVAKTLEGIKLILRLWTEDRVDFEGRYYSVKGAVLQPKPVQSPHPPIWFGTTGDYMMKLAARYGDGWIPTMISISKFGEGVQRLKEYRRQFNVQSGLTFIYDAYTPHNDVDSYVRDLEELEQTGCDCYTVHWRYPREEFVEKIKWFAKEVIPTFR